MSLRAGDSAERTIPLTAEDIDRYATLCGDTNPLHHDEAAARQSRFGGLIASGAHTIALLTGFCAAFTTGRAPCVGLEFSYGLRRAARTGDVLHLRWEVVSLEHSERLGGELVTLRGSMRDQDGALLVDAHGKVLAF